MVKIKKEEYFPRGSSNIAAHGGKKSDRSDGISKISHNLFSDKKSAKKTDNDANGSAQSKGKRKTSKNLLTAEETEILAGRRNRGDGLDIDEVTYDSVVEDLLTLGRVKKVRRDKLMVDLPGRLVGEIPLRNISKQYTDILEAVAGGADIDQPWYMLTDMFTEGQLLVLTVQKVQQKEKSKFIILSLNPSLVHKNFQAQNIQQGMIFGAAVQSVEDHGYIMDLGIKNTRAFLKKESAKNFIKHVNNGRPLGIGQIVECQVLRCKVDGSYADVQLTSDPKTIHKYVYPDETNLNYNLLLPGMAMEAIIMKTGQNGLQVHVQDLVGLIHNYQMKETWKSPTNFEIGDKVTAHVLYKFPTGTEPHLSLRPKLYPHSIVPYESSIGVGESVKATVVSYDKTGITVRFETGERGLVSLRRCSDNANLTLGDIKKQFPTGSTHSCKIISYNSMDSMFIGSFQASMLEKSIIHDDQVVPGAVLECTITAWNTMGALVSFGLVRGLIPRHHMGNIPFRNPEEKFPVGSTLKAKVIKKNEENGRICLTAKKELIQCNDQVIKTPSELRKYMIVKGTVKAVNNGGVILELIGGITGFIPRNFLGITLEDATPIDSMFFVGRILTAQVVYSKPLEKKFILSLEIREVNKKNLLEKPSDAKIKDVSTKENKKTEADNSKEANSRTVKVVEPPKKKKKNANVANTLDDVLEASKTNTKNAKEPNTSGDVLEALKMKKKAAGTDSTDAFAAVSSEASMSDLVDAEGNMKLSSSSFWDDLTENQGKSLSLSYTEAVKDLPLSGENGKKDKRTRKERKQLEEERTRNLELGMADYKTPLKTEDDYERLVLASPNSSMCWIQFMAFYLQNEDIPKAKEIGMRALKTILYREEQERLNVWVALLNLENKYGTPETLEAVFQEALRNNNDFKVYSVMADIFVESNKSQEAENTFKTMLKKFREVPDAYIKYGKFLYATKRHEEARKLFKKSLLNLNSTQHVRLISKNCQLEMEMGDVERGRTMFDQLLATYPKRVDLWIMNANIHVKLRDFENAKGVLKRAIDIGFPSKKMKPLFARLYEIDKISNNPNPDAIRELAMECAKKQGGDIDISLDME